MAIPCYRSDPEKLKSAVQSVLEQSSGDWTLHLVDGNQQPDPFLHQLVKRCSSSSVHYVRNETDRSMAGNWNFAFASAKTELVVLLHDDDFLAPDYISEMVDLTTRHPNASAYFCDVNLVNDDGVKTSTLADTIKSHIRPNTDEIELVGDSGLASLLKGCFIFCPTIVYRKSKLPNQPFDNTWQMVTDLQFYVQCLINNKSIVGTGKKLFYYRRHSCNQTAILTDNLLRFKEELNLYDRLIPELTHAGWSRSLFHAKYKVIIRLHLLYRATIELLKGRLSKVKQIIALAASRRAR
ncbi:glycosyltransferase [Pseudoalteromonas sp. YIC-656]|uniref:glycosyltransferase family 2 protein n=1 Tax=Pseudoalteromonas pernae TaxID=3118054 RepID=UPI0032427ED1